MIFIPENLQNYVESHTEPESDLLYRINRETHLHVVNSRMLSGHLQGRVLSFMSQIIRPQNILEIGTYTGYSALCLAEGLVEGGKLITIDKNEEFSLQAKSYFSESDFADQIEVKSGDALEIIPTLNKEWDMVFIDADKSNYVNYLKAVIGQTRTNGVIILDNVLWSGKVIDDSIKDKDTQNIRVLNQLVHDDRRIQNVLFPIRDGLMMLRKL